MAVWDTHFPRLGVLPGVGDSGQRLGSNDGHEDSLVDI